MARPSKWTEADIPDQRGKVAIVTGANSGLGLLTAQGLAQKGATVLLACRDEEKGRRALETIRSVAPEASLELMPLDLADLSAIRAFSDAFQGAHGRLDLLINNAGVMALPYRQTQDGFEMQFGTNHLGHFALTAHLLPSLRAAGEGARVVTVSSLMHKAGEIRFEDPNWTSGYQKWKAYGMSKLANLLFTYELQRRLERAGWPIIATAAHPGYASTNLQTAGPRLEGASVMEALNELSNRLIAQDARKGALPTLRAATDPQAQGGDYFGPDGIGEVWGYPTRVTSNARSQDVAQAERLWHLSEEMTGVSYSALEEAASQAG